MKRNRIDICALNLKIIDICALNLKIIGICALNLKKQFYGTYIGSQKAPVYKTYKNQAIIQGVFFPSKTSLLVELYMLVAIPEYHISSGNRQCRSDIMSSNFQYLE